MPDQTPAPLTDDELREIAANGWAPQGARLATELLAARVEIAALRNDLEAKGSDFDAACRHLGEARERIAELEADHARLVEDVASTVRRFSATLDERDALRARVAELEAQQGEPISLGAAEVDPWLNVHAVVEQAIRKAKQPTEDRDGNQFYSRDNLTEAIRLLVAAINKLELCEEASRG